MEKKMLVDHEIADLESVDGGGLVLTPSQRKILRLAMASYALAAVMDSAVRSEAGYICEWEKENELPGR